MVVQSKAAGTSKCPVSMGSATIGNVSRGFNLKQGRGFPDLDRWFSNKTNYLPVWRYFQAMLEEE